MKPSITINFEDPSMPFLISLPSLSSDGFTYKSDFCVNYSFAFIFSFVCYI